MRTIAVCTPSHHNTFIKETYESLCEQTYPYWTWYLMPSYDVPDNIIKDRRVRIIPYPNTTKIGQLKRKVFTIGAENHDIVVELDHDDVLEKTALEEVCQALEDNDFCYSDFSEFTEYEPGHIISHTYSDSLGWKTYPVSFRNRIVQATSAFPLNTISLTYICWAPNHIRAWRSETYLNLKGHAPFEAGDDFNLVFRTYLTTDKYKHINRCLYFYRKSHNSFPHKQNAIHYHTATTVSIHHLDAIRVSCQRKKLPFIVGEQKNPLTVNLPSRIGAYISTYEPINTDEVKDILHNLSDRYQHESWISLGIPKTLQDMQINEINQKFKTVLPPNWMLCYYTIIKQTPVLFFVYTNPEEHFPILSKTNTNEISQ